MIYYLIFLFIYVKNTIIVQQYYNRNRIMRKNMSTKKILLATEHGLIGKVPDGFTNMRVEFCWAKALDASFVPIDKVTHYPADVCLFILPKKTRQYDKLPLYYKEVYPESKVGVIQEGPVDLWMDWSPYEQEEYFNVLHNVDLVLCHNRCDKNDIEQLLELDTNKVKVLPTLYDDELLKDIDTTIKRDGILISGNLSSWYGGMLALQCISKDYKGRIAIPRSGRMTDTEVQWCKEHNIEVLPWQDYKEFMKTMNTFKLCINLMPTLAAGTFNLGAAVLRIPCIGIAQLDTQNFHAYNLSLYVSKHYVNYNRVRLLIQEVYNNLHQHTYYTKEVHKVSITEAKKYLRQQIGV